jgi:hypothetical protein
VTLLVVPLVTGRVLPLMMGQGKRLVLLLVTGQVQLLLLLVVMVVLLLVVLVVVAGRVQQLLLRLVLVLVLTPLSYSSCSSSWRRLLLWPSSGVLPWSRRSSRPLG